MYWPFFLWLGLNPSDRISGHLSLVCVIQRQRYLSKAGVGAPPCRVWKLLIKTVLQLHNCAMQTDNTAIAMLDLGVL